ncbi:hypothetical protein C8R47DRAFT_1131094 [Mycena vitilis]|nr:hypothetical protein C8R47DRAFT_1131094 [Mycena vitilis]
MPTSERSGTAGCSSSSRMFGILARTSTPRPQSWRLAPFRPRQSRTYYAPAALPRTLGARISIRAAGNARSKIWGLIATAHVSFAAWITFKVVSMKPLLLTTLAHVQRVDKDYAATSFDSYGACVDYSAKLCVALMYPAVAADWWDPFFRDVAALENDAGRQQAAHEIMRQAADVVHATLANKAPAGVDDWDAEGTQTVMQTALRMWVQSRVYAAMLPLMRALEELALEAHDEDVLHQHVVAATAMDVLAAEHAEKNHQILG